MKMRRAFVLFAILIAGIAGNMKAQSFQGKLIKAMRDLLFEGEETGRAPSLKL